MSNKGVTSDTDILSFLAESSLFAGLEQSSLSQIASSLQQRHLPANTPLFRAGERSQDEIYLIMHGRLSLLRTDGSQRDRTDGDILGLANYLDGSAYGATAMALQDTTLLVLAADQLRQLEQQHSSVYNAVNQLIVQRLRQQRPRRHALSGMMTRTVQEFMQSPVASCGPQTSLRSAFDMMQERKIGSLLVLDEQQKPLGVLTFSGLAQATLHGNANPQDSVMHSACEQPRTISASAPLWQAEEKLQQFATKYLIVLSDGAAVGMLSQSDIYKALTAAQGLILKEIESAKDIARLRSLYDELSQVAQQARENNRCASRAVRILSETHLALQRRCVELTLVQMQQQGRGQAPTTYAVIIMGSGGRKEMLLNPDQDNGIILPDTLDSEAQLWFSDFAALLNQNLDSVGYILCPGDIMARNPLFCKPVSQWCEQISHMTRYPNEKAARWSNIVFDFDTLYGDSTLTEVVSTHVRKTLQSANKLLEFMVRDDAEGRPPIGWFNRLVTSNNKEHPGKIDIKRNGLRIVADGARIFALRHGISSSNTLERLKHLMRGGILSADLVDSVVEAYEELLDLLLLHQIDQDQTKQALDKYIDPDALSESERSGLRSAMRAVKRFQEKLQAAIGMPPF